MESPDASKKISKRKACVDGAARTGLPGTATKTVSQDTSEANRDLRFVDA
jgi:hypothetical protein